VVYSLERARHWSILLGTAPLPASLRIKARYSLLARLQESMARRCDVMMIRHPKTGGTWIRALLTKLYAVKYGISDRRVFKADELQRQNAALPRYLITNGYFSWEKLVGEAFRESASWVEDKKILFITRHPGDIVVSWYIQYLNRTKAFKRELLEAEMKTGIDRDRISLFEFVQHPELGLPALIDYHNFWYQQLHNRPNAMILRYEDLRQDTETTTGKLADFLGEVFTPEQIREAVAFTDFDNMRKLEKSNYFRNISLRNRGGKGEEKRKVRRGKVGGYRGDLTPEQVESVEEQILERLEPGLGYGTTDGGGEGIQAQVSGFRKGKVKGKRG